MKNIKRGLSIAIVAAMVLGMTACGGSGKTENAGKAAEKKSFSLKLSHYRAEGSPADIMPRNLQITLRRLTIPWRWWYIPLRSWEIIQQSRSW